MLKDNNLCRHYSTDPSNAVTANTHGKNIVTSLCGEYPRGLGYECSEAGQLSVRHPFTSLYTGPPDPEYLQTLCQSHCYCPDLAPDVPEQLTPERPKQCVANGVENADGTQDATPAECTGTNYRDPRSLYYIVCSRIYGFPKKKDCISASRQMGRRIGHLIDDREFIGDGFAPAYDNYTRERTPQFFASKNCNISIDTRLASSKSGPRSDLENGNYLWGRAFAIRKKCVEQLGMGGWAVAGKQHRNFGAKFDFFMYLCEVASSVGLIYHRRKIHGSRRLRLPSVVTIRNTYQQQTQLCA